MPGANEGALFNSEHPIRRFLSAPTAFPRPGPAPAASLRRTSSAGRLSASPWGLSPGPCPPREPCGPGTSSRTRCAQGSDAAAAAARPRKGKMAAAARARALPPPRGHRWAQPLAPAAAREAGRSSGASTAPAPASRHVSGPRPPPPLLFLPPRAGCDARRRIYGAPLVTKIITSGGGRLPPRGKCCRTGGGRVAPLPSGAGRAAAWGPGGGLMWLRGRGWPAVWPPSPLGLFGPLCYRRFFCYWWAGGQQGSAEPIPCLAPPPLPAEWPRRRGREERPARPLAASAGPGRGTSFPLCRRRWAGGRGERWDGQGERRAGCVAASVGLCSRGALSASSPAPQRGWPGPLRMRGPRGWRGPGCGGRGRLPHLPLRGGQ